MKAGDTFQIVGAADKHLWVVVSDPATDATNVLIVNLTSYDPREDQTVILEPSDHPFIKHRTCVRYAGARVATDAQLEGLKAAGRLRPQTAVNPELLRQLRQGAAASQRTKIQHVQLLRDQGLTE